MSTIREVMAWSRRAQALANPTRLSIALAVRDHPGELVDRIADEVGRHQSLVSRHCQILHEAGVLDRFAKGRPHYTLSPYGKAMLAIVINGPDRH